MDSYCGQVDIAILPSSKDGYITEEDGINNDILDKDIPGDVCGKIVSHHEPEVVSDKERSDLKIR